jgi:hypothetical protein
MSFTQRVREVFQKLLESGMKVFTPAKDEYPETGVQPFDGDAYDETQGNG